MKSLKIVAVSLILFILAAAAGCSTGSASSTPAQTTVTRGDINVKVSGTGKTSYAQYAQLAFGSTGKIASLNIKNGDAVTKDSVLAQLETANLELALSQAKVAESAAKAAVIDAQMAVTQTQIGVTQAQQDVTQAESAQTQAEAALTAAQFNLDRIQAVGDIKDKLMKIQMTIAATEVNRKQANASGDNLYLYGFRSTTG